MPAPVVAIKSTTQEHLDVLDVVNDLVLLKDGSCCLILKVSAVNFNLLSDKEQEAIIFAYAGLLNSLTFSIQIVVKSQRKDVSKYLDLLQEQENAVSSEKKRQQIFRYRKFINQIVKEGNVLDKKFYCIIPFSRLELGLSASNPFSLNKPKTLPYDKTYIINKAMSVLMSKKDHLIRQFARVGLTTKQLTGNDIVQLLYNAYNPSIAKETGFSKIDRLDSPITQSLLTLKGEPPTSSAIDHQPIARDPAAAEPDNNPASSPEYKTEIVESPPTSESTEPNSWN